MSLTLEHMAVLLTFDSFVIPCTMFNMCTKTDEIASLLCMVKKYTVSKKMS